MKGKITLLFEISSKQVYHVLQKPYKSFVTCLLFFRRETLVNQTRIYYNDVIQKRKCKNKCNFFVLLNSAKCPAYTTVLLH